MGESDRLGVGASVESGRNVGDKVDFRWVGVPPLVGVRLCREVGVGVNTVVGVFFLRVGALRRRVGVAPLAEAVVAVDVGASVELGRDVAAGVGIGVNAVVEEAGEGR